MPRRESLSGRVVVVSPHLDDAVLSLAATIVRATRSGAHVDVLTVFAGDPASDTPAGGWDSRGGFATEGEAATARRAEDGEACSIIGAEPAWLPFGDGNYAQGRDRSEVFAAVVGTLAGADAVLVPGFPLTNPDHAWLAELLLGEALPCARVGLYAEQPYRYMVRGERRRLDAPGQISPRLLPDGIEWMHSARLFDLPLKRRAILAYQSQVPLLGFSAKRHRKLHRMLLDEALHRGEAIAWAPR
jgi:LmbE family N-acetylglucosaminyl deacetylase